MPNPETFLQTASLIVLHPNAPRLLCVRHPTFKSWMFPGGKVELGEAPHDAALRELEEEVGMAVALADMTDLPPWASDGNLRLPQPFAIIQERLPKSSQVYIDFVFVGVAKEPRLKFRGEILEADWFGHTALNCLDTPFPIKQLAKEVFERDDEMRSRAG